MTAVPDRIYEQPLGPLSHQCTQDAQSQDSHKGEGSKDGARRIQVAPSNSTAVRDRVPLADGTEDGSGVDVKSLFRVHVLEPLTAAVREMEELCSMEEEWDSSSSSSGYSSSCSSASPLSCRASIQKRKVSANSSNPVKTRRYVKTGRRTAREVRFSSVGSKSMVVAPGPKPWSSSLTAVSSGSSASSRAIQKAEQPASWLDASAKHLRTARVWIDRLVWMIKVATVVDDIRDRLLRPRDFGHA